MAADSLLRFRREYRFPDSWPVPLDQLLNFVDYLSFTGLSPTSVTTYILGIGYTHKARGLENKTNNFLITKILEGLRRKRVKSSDVRAPVTLDLLRRLLQALQKVCTSNYEVCLFSSAFTLAFFALLRIREITLDNKLDTGPHVICYEDISFSNKNEMYLRIRSSKADQRSNTITLIISKQKGSESDICPVKRLKQFLVMRYSGPTCSSPVYIHFDGSNLTRYQFYSVLLKTLQFCGLSEHIRSHSFRIGGTSELARRGVTESEIKRWGRWNSNAYSSYIQLSFLE
jgi:hypothetical protein